MIKRCSTSLNNQHIFEILSGEHVPSPRRVKIYKKIRSSGILGFNLKCKHIEWRERERKRCRPIDKISL